MWGWVLLFSWVAFWAGVIINIQRRTIRRLNQQHIRTMARLDLEMAPFRKHRLVEENNGTQVPQGERVNRDEQLRRGRSAYP